MVKYLFISVHRPELETKCFFSRKQPRISINTSVWWENTQEKDAEEGTLDTSWVPSSAGRHRLLPFHRKRPGPVTKNESEEFVSIEGLAGTQSMSTQTPEKASKGERAIISVLSLCVPDIGKNKGGIGKSAWRHHPKCFQLLF